MLKILFNKTMLIQGMTHFIFGMLGALIIFIFLPKDTLKVATIDITSLEESFIHETASQLISDKEKKEKVANFAKLLNQSIATLAKEKNVLFLPRQAVMSAVPDYTNTIAIKVKQGLGS
jgi:type F conjugative transfer system protein TrbI